MTAEMCRVSIRSAHRDTDVVVPADLPLCEVIPSVVDVVGAEGCGRDLHLVRADGDVLDADRSLAQCGVHDGEVLILTAATEPPHRAPFDLCDSVAGAVGRTNPDIPARHPATPVVGVLWSAAALAVLVGHNAFDATTGSAGAGCAAAISALVGAVVLRRDHRLATALGVVAAALAGLSALLVVPALPGFMLAMSAVSATSLLAWRLLDCGTGTFVPLAGMTMAAAAATLAASLGWLAPAGIGPVLTTASLAGSGGRPAAGGTTVRTVCIGVARGCRAPCGECRAHPDLARHGVGCHIGSGVARHRRSHRATTRGRNPHRRRRCSTVAAQSDSPGPLPCCGTADLGRSRGVGLHRAGGSQRAVDHHLAVRIVDRRRGDRDGARLDRSGVFPPRSG